MPRHRTLTFPEQTSVWQLLQKYTKDMGDGSCSYLDGWSDQQIAQTVKVTVDQVGRFRVKEFKKRLATRTANGAGMKARIATLETSTVDLCRRLENLEKEYWSFHTPKLPSGK